MVSTVRKIRTFVEYAGTGIRLGMNLRSKWVLASMLPRLKWQQAWGLGDSEVYTTEVQVTHLKHALHFRAHDIFIIREVLGQNPYILPQIKEGSPRCILDLGAHIGLATFRFKAEFPEAKIYCYEPDPENFRLLKQNTAGLPGVVLHQEAVGGEHKKAKLYVNRNRHSSSSLQPRPDVTGVYEVECVVRPLDDILHEAGGTIDLIKVDIEGVEYEVFSKSTLVHQVKWVVGEMKASPQEIQAFVELFRNHEATIRPITSQMSLVYLRHRRTSSIFLSAVPLS